MHRILLVVTASLSMLAASSLVTGCGDSDGETAGAPAALGTEPPAASLASEAGADPAASDGGPMIAEDAATVADAADAGADAAAEAGPVECTASESRLYPIGACGEDDRVGECTPKPALCSGAWNPVCGCNGKTYANVCKATQVGVSLRTLGTCP